MCVLWGERRRVVTGRREECHEMVCFLQVGELSDENTAVVSVALARMLPTMSGC